ARFAASAFDGEGARVAGGRWNSPGLPVVYTADSAALAALELLVNLGRGSLLSSFVLISCTFDEALVLRLDRSRLPHNWRAYPAPPTLQTLGDAWLHSGTSAVLEVPSAVIDTAVNYLFNPRHPDFVSITRAKPHQFEFDLRLLG